MARNEPALWDSIVEMMEQSRDEEPRLHLERLAAIGMMVIAITHESRNAVQIMQANLELLELEVPPEADAWEYIRRTQVAQRRLISLFEELRTFGGPIILNCELCKLDGIVDRALQQLRDAGTDKQVIVQHDVHTRDLHCSVDQLRMERVFCNLLDNSLAACPEPVSIHALWDDAQLDNQPALRLTLLDNGPGLSEDVKQKLFTPFYTTKPRGTGLGMAITKQIIESHGGRIVVGNNQDAGAEFIITLPRELGACVAPSHRNNTTHSHANA